MVTKERTFYSILELWLFTSHMDICGCSFILLFYLFCCFCSHVMGGVCKCASAIRTLSGVCVVIFFSLFFIFCSFEDEWQASQQQGQGPLTGSLCLGSWDLISSGAEAEKSRTGLFCGELSAGLQNPGGNWEDNIGAPAWCACLHLSPRKHSHPALTRLTYALLFIQAVRYNFGDGSTITTGGLLRLWQSHWKRYSQTEIRDSRSSSSPTSCT